MAPTQRGSDAVALGITDGRCTHKSSAVSAPVVALVPIALATIVSTLVQWGRSTGGYANLVHATFTVIFNLRLLWYIFRRRRWSQACRKPFWYKFFERGPQPTSEASFRSRFCRWWRSGRAAGA